LRIETTELGLAVPAPGFLVRLLVVVCFQPLQRRIHLTGDSFLVADDALVQELTDGLEAGLCFCS
jgi:hypothetical protein